ncbi:ankyrin repeat-containing domain protein, partial [Colletotrichum navitas]
ENCNQKSREDGPEAFRTAIHIAAAAGHDTIISTLLASGELVVDERDSGGNTALHVAVVSRKTDVVACLLSCRADANAENALGWTPLHIAIQIGYVEAVTLLIAYGGDLTKKVRGNNVNVIK